MTARQRRTDRAREVGVTRSSLDAGAAAAPPRPSSGDGRPQLAAAVRRPAPMANVRRAAMQAAYSRAVSAARTLPTTKK